MKFWFVETFSASLMAAWYNCPPSPLFYGWVHREAEYT